MRKFVVAGNWKMNTNLPEGEQLASDIMSLLGQRNFDLDRYGVIIAPPYTHLYRLGQIIDNNKIRLGAQNMGWEEKGAFTGEISADMLLSVGVEYVIIGHSERRKYQKEDDQLLLKKINLALAKGLKPIFCVGEELNDREAGKHFDVVRSQIENVIFSLEVHNMENIIIAYEPVWAIGTGKVATPGQAQEMHAFIRQMIADKFGSQVGVNMTLLYGGSCKPSNAEGLFSQKDIDGGLIGGASLKAQDFVTLVDMLIEAK